MSPKGNISTRRGKGHLNPFEMLANSVVPTDYYKSLDFAAEVYYKNGIYQEATKRVFGHFITDIAFEEDGGDTTEQKDHRNLLVDSFNIFQGMQTLGVDHAAYGIGIQRMHFPYHRYLLDNRGGQTDYYSVTSIPLRTLRFHKESCQYSVPDPKLIGNKKYPNIDDVPRVKMDFKDIHVKDKDKIRWVPLDPRYCRFDYGYMTKERRVVYQFDPEHKNDIKGGNVYQANNTPEEMLRAICDDKDFRFEPDSVFVFTDPTLTGVSKKGLGIPKILAHFQELYQLQLYRKIDEMVAKDYMLPIRMFAPSFTKGGGNGAPQMTMDTEAWKNSMAQMVKRHRDQGDSMFAVPYSTEYTEATGNGKQLAQAELIEIQTTTLLNSLGYPAELFNGTLAFQQIPTAVRLFERTQHFIPHRLNQYLGWCNRKICQFLGTQEYEVKLQPPRIADDQDKKNIIMQLVQAGEAPREELWNILGLRRPADLFRDRMKEDGQFEEERLKASEELEKKLGPNPMEGQGGPAMAEDGSAGGSPLSVEQEAMQKAEQWSQMEEGARRQDMQSVLANNPTMHALATQYLKQIRQKGENAGRDQVVNPN